jgi:hypothetical protein
MPHPTLLYDGVCGLCNRFVQFILHRDRRATFRFASLQSDVAAKILSRHGLSPNNLDMLYVVVNLDARVPNELLLCRSQIGYLFCEFTFLLLMEREASHASQPRGRSASGALFPG